MDQQFRYNVALDGPHRDGLIGCADVTTSDGRREDGPAGATDLDFDFLVIGSGFGGSVAALRLSEKGFRVGVLEMGRRYRPEDLPRTSWDVRRYLWMPALGCYGVQQITLLRDVVVMHGAGVGGGSLVYGNVLFEPAEGWFGGPDWPEGRDWKAALAPHYATAKRMLGVVMTPFLGETDRILRDTAEEMGRGATFHLNPIGVFFGDGPGVRSPDPYFGGEGPERSGCTLCGSCMVGCREGAKNTLDRNYLYLAERRGAVILPETRAVDLRSLEQGGYAVTVEPSTARARPRRVLKAREVVVAAGVLGTLDLLFRCRERGSLPHLSPALGQRVRTNGEALVGARARSRDADFSRGTAIQSGFWPEPHTHIEVCRYPRGSDLLGLLNTFLVPGGGKLPRWLRWLGQILLHPRTFLSFFDPRGWAKRSAILLVMQSIDNRLDLSLRRRWYWPFSRQLDTAGGARRPPSWIGSADDTARRFARRIDGTPENLLPGVLLDTSATAHIIGGCAMGRDAATGVVDERCRVFGHPGLYVVDGTVIPKNLGTNPSLTIAALAEWAMSHVPPRKEAA